VPNVPVELRRGALAGLAGGAALAIVLVVAGEGPLQQAIDLEAADAGDALVSRSGQRVGGILASLLVGAALGVVFSLVSRATPRLSSGRLAAAAFVALHLVPFLKYPANPPGVGDPESAARRTALYVVLLAWSVLAGWAGLRARRWLQARRTPAQLVGPGAVVVVLALVGIAFVVLPPGPSPDAVPASVVWSFRVASLAGWAAYWAVAGTVLAWARERQPVAAGVA
jgi:hypothetical protein